MTNHNPIKKRIEELRKENKTYIQRLHPNLKNG